MRELDPESEDLVFPTPAHAVAQKETPQVSVEGNFLRALRASSTAAKRKHLVLTFDK